MAFHFTLKALLRLREALEKAELDKLRTIATQVIHLRDEIESLNREADEEHRMMLAAAVQGITGAELRFAALCESAYKQRHSTLVQKLDDLELERQKCLNRYAEVRRQREILSNLRERKLAEYNIGQSRREQQQLDELFLMRRGNQYNA